MLRVIVALKFKSLKAQLQYPFNFAASIVGISMIGVMDILLIVIPVSSFGLIGGWGFWELGFMFSMWKMSHGLHQALFIPFWGHDTLIQKGGYDRLLARPVHPIPQILASGFSVAAIGEWVPSVTMFAICASHIAVSWNIFSVGFFLIVIISGAVIEWSLVLAWSSFGFWIVSTGSFRGIAHTFLFRVNHFPAHIYPRILALVLTFVFPYAFMSYYPTHYFFQLDAEIFLDLFAYATPLVAVCLWGVAFAFYSFALRHYSSTGT